MTEPVVQVERKESVGTLSSITLASPSPSEEKVVKDSVNGVIQDTGKVAQSQNQTQSDTTTTKPSTGKSGDSEESSIDNKRPWFPKLSLWKRKQKERTDEKSFLRFFRGLKPKKTASSYSTLEDPQAGCSSTTSTLERKVSRHREDLKEPLAVANLDVKPEWRRFDPRRFPRRLSQFAEFGRRKWRGLRRASSSVGVRIRRTFSRLSITRSSTNTTTATDGTIEGVNSVFSVPKAVPDLAEKFSLNTEGYEPKEGETFEIVTNSSMLEIPYYVSGDPAMLDEDIQVDFPCTDEYGEASPPLEIGDPTRTPTPPILAGNSCADL